MEKLVPKLRFPEFEGNWEEKQIKNVFSIFNGYAFSSLDSTDYGCLWVKIADVGIQEMKKDSLSYLPKDYLEKHSKFTLKEGDLVIALTRPILNGNLKISRIDKFFNNSLLNQRVGKIVSNYNLEYIYYLLQNNKLIKSIENNIAGSDPPNLSPNEINNIYVRLPILSEQQKIATFLTSVDERLTLLAQQKEKLELYKKGVMQQIFSQKLRFKDENGNECPDWEEKKLGDLVDVVKGKQLNKEELSEVGTYPCQNGGIEPSGYTEEFNTIENTITISEGGNSCGYVNFMTSKFWCGGHCYSLLNIKNNVMKQFLFQYLKFNQNEIMKLRVGSGLPNIQKGSIANFRIEIPCLEEQQKIASFLSAIDVQIEGVSKKIEQTKLFKKGLLQQLFV